MLFKNKEIQELKAQIKRIEDNYESLYKVINHIGNDVRAVIDTLVRKKIIKVSKKELKRCATRDEIENRLTVIELKLGLKESELKKLKGEKNAKI